MKVLLSVTSTALSYGGPAISVVSLAEALKRIGCSVCLWSPNHQFSSEQAPAVSSTNLTLLSGPLSNAVSTWGYPDVVHDNGIWLPHNHQISRLAVRSQICRIVSPRGMLSPWSRKHKRLKKMLAWTVYQKRDLRLSCFLHATSEDEAQDLRQLNLRTPVVMLPNGVDIPDTYRPSVPPLPSTKRVRTALFLGRIYPVKGLPNLIEAWATVNPEGWRLLIAGPDEGGHKRELEAQIRRLGVGSAVEFRGPVTGADKAQLLASADLFILPSLSESFGMALAEAMLARLPVLTTVAVPWPDVEVMRLGWRVELNKSSLVRGLREATSMPAHQLRAMGQCASEYVRENYSWDKLAEQYVSMYHAAIASNAFVKAR